MHEISEAEEVSLLRATEVNDVEDARQSMIICLFAVISAMMREACRRRNAARMMKILAG